MFVFPDVGAGGAIGPNLQSILGTPTPLYLSWTQPPNNFDTTALSVLNNQGGQNVWSNHGFSPAPATCTATLNSVSGPDGSPTGTKWTETTTTGNHWMINAGRVGVNGNNNNQAWQSPTRVAGIFKAGTRTRVVLEFHIFNPSSVSEDVSVGFDLIAGAAFDQVAGTNWTIIGSPATRSLGNGWWLVWFDAKLADTTNGNYNISANFYIDAGSGAGARNISYVGDGASGLFEWWVNVSPTAGWAILNGPPVFYDDFTSQSVDLNNTLNTSLYKWFLKCDWPNVPTVNWGIGAGCPPAVGSNISIANSVLTWITPGTAGASRPSSNNYIFTAFADPITPSIVRGTTIVANKPTLFQVRMAWGPLVAFAGTWPSFWGQATEGLAGGTFPFGELDFIEVLPFQSPSGTVFSTPSTGGFSWTGTSGGTNQNRGFGAVGGTATNQLNAPFNQQWQTISALYIPSSANGGSGFGTFMGSADQTGGTIANAYTWGSGDPLAAIEGQHYPIILGGGNTFTTAAQLFPTYYDWVRVMQ